MTISPGVLARAAKIVALLAFVLPWAAVSCAGEDIATVSGLDLATGSITMHDPVTGELQREHADPVVWIILALVTIGGGLLAGLALRGKTAAATLLGTATAALAACVLGMQFLKDSVAHDPGRYGDSVEEQLDAAIMAQISIKEQPGYWTALGGLAAAMALSLWALGVRVQASPPAGSGAGAARQSEGG